MRTGRGTRRGGRGPGTAAAVTTPPAGAIALPRCAGAAGPVAGLVGPPYYNNPTREGLYRHFKAVAEAVPVPQILYNVPGRTAVDMQVDTVDRLADISNIVGIKDATGNLERGKELIGRCGDRMDIYSGDDASAMELILMGAKGDISVTANVAPRAMHDMCAAALAGDRQGAEAVNAPLLALHKNLFVEANPIPVKWALYAMGLIPSGIRLPLTMLSERHHETVRQALKQAGVHC